MTVPLRELMKQYRGSCVCMLYHNEPVYSGKLKNVPDEYQDHEVIDHFVKDHELVIYVA